MSYFFIAFGPDARSITRYILPKAYQNHAIVSNDRICVHAFSKNPYHLSTIVWNDDNNQEIGLLLYGTPIATDASLNELISDPKRVLKGILMSHATNTKEIPDCFRNGAYVGAIIDSNSQKIQLFSSFYGIPPVYFHVMDATLLVSDSINLLIDKNNIEFNPEGIAEYLHFGRLSSKRTLVRHINQIPCAQTLIFQKGEASLTSSHNLPQEDTHTDSEEVLAKTYSLWKDSVSRVNLKQKDCTRLSLSGGFDSRLIISEWEEKEKLIVESYSKDEDQEVRIARNLVDVYGGCQRYDVVDYDAFLNNKDLVFKNFLRNLKKIDNPLFMSVPSLAFDYEQNPVPPLWIQGRGGEVMGGDFLYRGRGAKNLIEDLFFMKKTKLIDKKMAKILSLFEMVFYSKNKTLIYNYLDSAIAQPMSTDIFKEVWKGISNFLASALTEEALIERIRSIAHNQDIYCVHLHNRDFFEYLSPYFDRILSSFLFSTSLDIRSSRRLQLQLMKRYYSEASHIMLTSSLTKPKYPHFLHELNKLRHLLSIGFKDLIGFHSSNPRYLFPSNMWYLKGNEKVMKFIENTIVTCPFFKSKIQEYLSEFLAVKKQKWKHLHTYWENIWNLFKLALAEKRFSLPTKQYDAWVDEIGCLSKTHITS